MRWTPDRTRRGQDALVAVLGQLLTGQQHSKPVELVPSESRPGNPYFFGQAYRPQIIQYATTPGLISAGPANGCMLMLSTKIVDAFTSSVSGNDRSRDTSAGWWA
jgi:hypothetical protein